MALLLVSIWEEQGKNSDGNDGDGLKGEGEHDKTVPLTEFSFLVGSGDMSLLNFSGKLAPKKPVDLRENSDFK